MDLYDIIQNISNTSSSLEKIKILEENKTNKELLKFFIYALDISKVYNVVKLPKWKDNFKDDVSFEDSISLLDKLASRELTGNSAKFAVENLMNNSNSKIYDIFTRMISKKPRCGVSIALCSKIWPNKFTKKVYLCKAQQYSDKAISKIKYPAISQKKCDGERCLAFITKDDIKFYSSRENIFYQLDKSLGEDALKFRVYDDEEYVLDGELLVLNEEENAILSRKEGNGILNKIIRCTASMEEINRVRMVIWDKIPLDEYYNKCPSKTYIETMKTIVECEQDFHPEKISVVEYKIVDNETEAISHFIEMLKLGEEGTIIKNLDMKWEGKRSTNAIKFKVIIENTLKIVDIFEGTGKYQGMLGGIICESEDGKLSVKVGSGLLEEDRKNLYTKDIIGSLVEIKSNGVIKSESGEYSLFLPRFKNMRYDKNKADTLETILTTSSGASELMSKLYNIDGSNI